MSLTDLSLKEFAVNISNAFVGLLNDLYVSEDPSKPPEATITNADLANNSKLSPDTIVRALTKENRYMYVALLVILCMLIGNTLFATRE